jgi:type IV secretory pathway protease TraF
MVAHPILTTLATLLLVTVTLAKLLPDRFLVLNLSPSVAYRLYVLVDAEPGIGDLVEFRTPNEAFHSDHLSPPSSILKPIAAGPGDRIDTTGECLFINGDRVAPIFTRDSEGLPLPVWRVNRTLESDEFFVLSTRVWNSLDSRYLGSIRRHQIIAVRVPVSDWIEGRQAKATPKPSTSASE